MSPSPSSALSILYDVEINSARRRIVVIEQVPEIALRRIQKISGQAHMFGVARVNLANAVIVALQHRGTGVAQQDRRVRGDDELRVAQLTVFRHDMSSRMRMMGSAR